MQARLDAIATLLDQGAADSAVRLLRSSWEPELPSDERIPVYCMWIRGLCETGELDQALTLARRAAEEFPREPDILIALGNVLDMHGLLEEARDAFAVAIDSDPAGSLQRYNLGAVLERLGEEEQAESCYRGAIDMIDDAPMLEAHAALGSLLRRQGRLEEAEEVYDAYLEEDPLNVDMLVEHGICLSDLEVFGPALERFDVALSFDPHHGGAWYNKAITLYRIGRYADALEAMRGAHASDPTNPLTLAVLGAWIMSQSSGDLDEALGHVYRALDELMQLHDMGDLSPAYASLVIEELFESLWHHDRRREAREVARIAGQRDWITPHMLETLNRADNGTTDDGTAYRVTARAETDERPDYWPDDAFGFTTDLMVVAKDESEARELTLAWLEALEPKAKFEVRVIDRGANSNGAVRGVARIESYKAFFRA